MDNFAEYVNYVKISGIIDKVRNTESGSYFGRIIQKDILKNKKKIQHFYEFYVEANKANIIKMLFQKSLVLIEGSLTIFKFKLNHKLVINVKTLTVLKKKI